MEEVKKEKDPRRVHHKTSSRNEVELRIAEIREDMLNRMTRKNIIEKYTKKFNLSMRQIDKYIAYIKEEFKEKAKEDADRFYEYNIGILRDIINNNINEDDEVVLKAINTINKMCDLDNSKKNINITDKEGQKIEIEYI